MSDRLFLSDDGIWCDRMKPVSHDGAPVVADCDSSRTYFQECDPVELVDELEVKLAKAMEFARHQHHCVYRYGQPCICGWAEARKEIES